MGRYPAIVRDKRVNLSDAEVYARVDPFGRSTPDFRDTCRLRAFQKQGKNGARRAALSRGRIRHAGPCLAMNNAFEQTNMSFSGTM